MKPYYILLLLAASAFGQCPADHICAQASDAGFTASVLWSATPQSPQVRYANNFSFSRTLPNGIYVVTMYFVEPNATGKGQRLFNVDINQQATLSRLDIFDLSGGAGKVLKRVAIVAVIDGTIKISFDTAGARPAVVSAIRIAPLGITLSE